MGRGVSILISKKESLLLIIKSFIMRTILLFIALLIIIMLTSFSLHSGEYWNATMYFFIAYVIYSLIHLTLKDGNEEQTVDKETK